MIPTTVETMVTRDIAYLNSTMDPIVPPDFGPYLLLFLIIALVGGILLHFYLSRKKGDVKK